MDDEDKGKAPPIKLTNMELGTMVEFEGGVKAIVISDMKVDDMYTEAGKAFLILTTPSKDEYCVIASGTFEDEYTKGKYKVLGKIKKIIVEEQ